MRDFQRERGGYCEFAKRLKPRTRLAGKASAPFVEEAFYADGKRYGSRRVAPELKKGGGCSV